MKYGSKIREKQGESPIYSELHCPSHNQARDSTLRSETNQIQSQFGSSSHIKTVAGDKGKDQVIVANMAALEMLTMTMDGLKTTALIPVH